MCSIGRYGALTQFVPQKDAMPRKLVGAYLHMCRPIAILIRSNTKGSPSSSHSRTVSKVQLSAMPHVHLNTTHARKQVMKGGRCFLGAEKSNICTYKGGIHLCFFGRLPLQASILIDYMYI